MCIRDRGYSAIRGDRQVYTPQAVINGASHTVGSERDAIDKAIVSTKRQPAVLSVAVGIEKSDTGLKAVIPQSVGLSGHVWVLSTVRERSVQIGRGENTGRNMVYSNVVRSLTRIGAWNGEAASIEIPKSAIAEDAEGLVVLLQQGSEKKPGQIIGAGRRVLGSNVF